MKNAAGRPVRTICLALAIVASLVGFVPAHAETNAGGAYRSAEGLWKQAVAARSSGDLKRAATQFEAAVNRCAPVRECLDESEATLNPFDDRFKIDEAAMDAARLFSRFGDEDRAQVMADVAVRARESHVDKVQGDRQRVALMSLALACERAGRYEEAASAWERAAHHPVQEDPPRHPGLEAQAAAAAYARIGAYQRAIPLQREGLAAMTRGKKNGGVDSDTDQEIHTMIRYLRGAGDLGSASRLVDSMLSVYRTLSDADMVEHQFLATQFAGWLREHAELLSDRGRQTEALNALREAYVVVQKAFPKNSGESVAAQARIALQYRAMGDFARAAQLAHTLLEDASTPDMRDVVARYLAPMLADFGETDRVRTLLEQATRHSNETAEVILGAIGKNSEDDWITRTYGDVTRMIAAKVRIAPAVDLGVAQLRAGDPVHAAQTLERALRYAAMAEEMRSNRTIRLLAALAKAEYESGKRTEAIAHARQAQTLAVHALPLGHPDRITALVARAELASQSGASAEAVQQFEQARAELAKRPDALMEGEALFAYAQHFARSKQPDVAILIGKSAVNAVQSARQRLKDTDQRTQELLVTTRSGYYQTLAGWLIDEARFPEAQQVLAMLKEQELFDYIRGDVKNDPRSTRAALTPHEESWQKRYAEVSGRLAALGAEEEMLRGKARSGLTQAEQKRRTQVEDDLRAAQVAFDKFLASIVKEAEQAGPSRARAVGERNLYSLRALQGTLANLGEGVVALHYLVGEEKVSILLTTSSVQVARTSSVNRSELNRKIAQFRRVLQDPNVDAVPPARELYRLLIAPVAEDLRQAKAQTLMVSLDGALRYMPIAALHDGKQYLVESYRVAIFTEAARDKLKDKPQADWKLTGLGVTRAIGEFDALPSVRDELEGIVKRQGHGVLPGDIYLDKAFTAQRLRDSLERGYPVLHVASHFVFRPGTESNSFLLLGDGSHFSLRDVKETNLDFRDVDLITLSACDTAVGGGRDANGAEIEGFGALAQRQGAHAVMATLWPVADRSTGLFMQNFYRDREATPRQSKAEALRRAQVAFIRGRDGAKPRYAHPFYWAPFILMGNWL